jgi:hypothetical protein
MHEHPTALLVIAISGSLAAAPARQFDLPFANHLRLPEFGV